MGAGLRAPRRHGTLFGLGGGQLVAVEIAAALVLATVGAAPWLLAAAPVALVILVAALGRFREHWIYEWLTLGTRYLGRRRVLAPGADARALLALVRPDAIVTSIDADGARTGVIEDAYGLTAVLELGDPAALLGEAAPLAPPPAELLHPPNADQPRVRLQLLLSALPAPGPHTGPGSPSTSYRQLTEGRVPASQRAFLAVQVRRVGGFGEADLRRALSSAVRRVCRRFAHDGLPCRALNPEAALRALGELAHLGGADGLREEWAAVGTGGLRQVSLLLRRWPDVGGDPGRSLLAHVLALPGAATAVSLAVERPDADEVRVELVVRLASPGPQSQAVALAALRRLLRASGTRARRLDGTQLAGLAATLPLGGAVDPATGFLADLLDRSAGAAVADGVGLRTSPQLLAGLELPPCGDGLAMGVNRHGEPTPVRLFRSEPTRVALFGLRYAQLLALRALALGARVVVWTGRPQAWEAFARGVSGSGDALAVLPTNRALELGPASPLLPQLVIVDAGGTDSVGAAVR
ncbi:type VII secretion protein EccE [Planosporangium thailandense]|nr:type VII secretion protein EccE [Planosporangium thailandense]